MNSWCLHLLQPLVFGSKLLKLLNVLHWNINIFKTFYFIKKTFYKTFFLTQQFLSLVVEVSKLKTQGNAWHQQRGNVPDLIEVLQLLHCGCLGLTRGIKKKKQDDPQHI